MCEIRKQLLSVSPYSQHGHAVLISVLSTINKYILVKLNCIKLLSYIIEYGQIISILLPLSISE